MKYESSVLTTYFREITVQKLQLAYCSGEKVKP